MAIKLRVYGELSAKVGSELIIEEGKGDVREILRKVLSKRNINLSDIENEYVILVNGRVVKGSLEVKDGDVIALLPIFFGGTD